MKTREPRRPVMLKARLRDAAGWRDACILNLSSKGLMIHADAVPGRGTILEVRRGSHVIVAQVMWSSDRRAGLKAQDAIHVESISSDAEAPATGQAREATIERRARPRRDDTNQASRERGRMMEFGSLALALATGAALISMVVGSLYESSLAQVTAVLG